MINDTLPQSYPFDLLRHILQDCYHQRYAPERKNVSFMVIYVCNTVVQEIFDGNNILWALVPMKNFKPSIKVYIVYIVYLMVQRGCQ